MPQIVLDQVLTGKGVVAVTQPRRVAATSVAERVAGERACPLGTQASPATGSVILLLLTAAPDRPPSV